MARKIQVFFFRIKAGTSQPQFKNNMGFVVKQRPGDGTVLNCVHVGSVVLATSCCFKGFDNFIHIALRGKMARRLRVEISWWAINAIKRDANI